MARSHARILVTIWADPDWRTLPRDCQWFYILLLSQPQITHCGVAQIPRRGWVNASGDDDNHETIASAMKILADRRYLIVDEDTDEVLVRSFMRHDGVISGPPGTLKNALVAARAVVSPRLRAALHAELAKVDPAEIADKRVRAGHEHPTETLAATLRALESEPPSPGGGGGDGVPDAMPDPITHPMPDAMGNGIAHGIADAIADGIDSYGIGNGMGYGSGVGEGVGVSSCLPVGSNSTSVGTATRRGSRGPGTDTKRGTRLPDDFAVTDAMRDWARTHTPNVGPTDHDAFVDYWRGVPGSKGCKLDWVGTWRNWMRRAQGEAERRPAHLRSVQAAPAPVLRTFDDYRREGAAKEAARLIRRAYLPAPQHPDDRTPYRDWVHAQAVKFIDTHAAALRAALTETRTG